MKIRTFKIHWLTGEPWTIRGPDLGNQVETVTNAANRAGIGGGAVAAIDYWEEIYEEDTEKEVEGNN